VKNGLGRVEASADRIRDGLLLTLKELDRRKDRALDLRGQLARRRSVVLKVGAGALITLILLAGAQIARSHRRRRRLPRERIRALYRLWRHPERLGSGPPAASLGQELGKRLIGLLATTLARQVAQRAAESLVSR
jgi:hypothetical protein